MMGVYTANESRVISRSRDKLRSLQILSRTDVQMQRRGFAQESLYKGFIDAVGRPPLVVKLLQGTQVVGVVLVESKSAARSVIDAFRQLEAHIDSGAQTSSIHAFRPRFSQKDDGEWVSFETHPRRRSRKDAVRVKAKVKTRRIIRSSNVKSELRPMIETTMTMGGETFVSELTLENRFLMAYRMILGRSAMRGRFTIDPSKSYLFGE